MQIVEAQLLQTIQLPGGVSLLILGIEGDCVHMGITDPAADPAYREVTLQMTRTLTGEAQICLDGVPGLKSRIEGGLA